MCIMFVNQRAFGDFKKNVRSLAPGEASTHNSKKRLKSCSLNSFDSSANVCDSKKTDFGLKNVDVKKVFKDKEHLQPLKRKVKVPDIKVESCSDDSWPDIEHMLVPDEPECTTHNSKKRLKSCSLNSFDSSANVCDSKKTDFGLKNVDVKKVFKDKENLQPLKPKVKVPDIKVESCSDDSWPDIEQMLRPDDPRCTCGVVFIDDLPEFERIQKKDIDYKSPEFIEQTVDRLPPPLKDYESKIEEINIPDTCIPDIDIPQIPPLDLSILRYDYTELEPMLNI